MDLPLHPKYLIRVFIIIFIITGSVSAINTTPTHIQSRGNTLYVGGTGPGNYTKIQDAINNASIGITIYVYPGTYEESLTIKVNALSLIGHDRNTTKIDSNKEAITIKADGCKISQFTITTLWSSYDGIVIDTDEFENQLSGIRITNNRFIRCHTAVDIDAPIASPYMVEFITIDENIFTDNTNGIASYGMFNRIYHNTFKDNFYGIFHQGIAAHITQNYIDDCLYSGVTIGGTFNIVARNSIQNCDLGIDCGCFFANIHNNNFYNNSINAFLNFGLFNRFFRNYWNESRILPYPIKGEFHDFDLNEYTYYDFDFFPRQSPNILLPETT